MMCVSVCVCWGTCMLFILGKEVQRANTATGYNNGPYPYIAKRVNRRVQRPERASEYTQSGLAGRQASAASCCQAAADNTNQFCSNNNNSNNSNCCCCCCKSNTIVKYTKSTLQIINNKQEPAAAAGPGFGPWPQTDPGKERRLYVCVYVCVCRIFVACATTAAATVQLCNCGTVLPSSRAHKFQCKMQQESIARCRFSSKLKKQKTLHTHMMAVCVCDRQRPLVGNP